MPVVMTPDNRSQTAMLIGFVLLFLMIFLSFWLADQQKQTFAMVRQTLEVEGRLSTLRSDIQEAETGQRGYLLTGQTDYLAPYESAIARIDGDVKALGAATADDPRQQALMRRLRDLVAARQVRLSQTIALYRGGAMSPKQLGPGKALMDQIHDVVIEIKAQERGLLQLRERTLLRQASLAQAGSS